MVLICNIQMKPRMDLEKGSKPVGRTIPLVLNRPGESSPLVENRPKEPSDWLPWSKTGQKNRLPGLKEPSPWLPWSKTGQENRPPGLKEDSRKDKITAVIFYSILNLTR